MLIFAHVESQVRSRNILFERELKASLLEEVIRADVI